VFTLGQHDWSDLLINRFTN